MKVSFGGRIRDLAAKLGKEEQDIAADLGLSKSGFNLTTQTLVYQDFATVMCCICVVFAKKIVFYR